MNTLADNSLPHYMANRHKRKLVSGKGILDVCIEISFECGSKYLQWIVSVLLGPQVMIPRNNIKHKKCSFHQFNNFFRIELVFINTMHGLVKPCLKDFGYYHTYHVCCPFFLNSIIGTTDNFTLYHQVVFVSLNDISRSHKKLGILSKNDLRNTINKEVVVCFYGTGMKTRKPNNSVFLEGPNKRCVPKPVLNIIQVKIVFASVFLIINARPILSVASECLFSHQTGHFSFNIFHGKAKIVFDNPGRKRTPDLQ